jgi:protocatechuate 3,4-dioxygenase beta subunit
MDRKNFLKKGLIGLGAVVALPVAITSCKKEEETISGSCDLSPSETAGPFPIKTPADLVRENIVSDRTGVALLVTLTIQDQSQDCSPLSGVLVDLWHCDADGNYSQYGGTQMQSTDYTSKNFLRGRQTTDANGQVSFISIFPGWYSSRAPHIHIEVLDSNENSIRVTQIAFPKSVCDVVYATSAYKGTADTTNEDDNVFSDSVDENMADSITGNTTDGYTLLKTIVV